MLAWGQGGFAALCVLPLVCGYWGAFLRRFWLRLQPRGSLRRPRRARGIAISRLRTVRIRAQCSVRLHRSRTPVALRATYAGPPWILLYPLKRRRSAEGLEAAERCVLARRSAVGAKGLYVALRFSVALRLSRRHSCAAVSCGSSHVAASGGQGGLGGLRFPPRPSLDSPLPLETPPLRYGVGGGGAARSYAALCLVAKG